MERTPDKELPPATATVSEHSNVSNNNNNINNNNNNGSIDRSDVADTDIGRHKDRSAEPNNNLDHKIKDNKYKQGDGDDDDDDEDDNEHDDDDDESKATKHRKREYSNNSNNTRTLTQQSSLVAPSEVHISCSPSLTAEPVLTPNGT